MTRTSGTVRVLYFAAARERAGLQSEDWPWTPGLTVEALLQGLAGKHPGLAPLLRHLRVAVDQEFALASDVLPDGAEVALVPPVAGGAGLFRVVDRPLVLQEVVDAVAGEAFGGLVTFTGTVRDVTKGRRVVKLEYEAYAPMAERKLAEIAGEVTQAYPGARVAVVHRVGTLMPGEFAVVIAAAAPHRKEAFRACEQTLERLKEDVPIWKKEHFEDGQVWVGLGP